MVTEVTDNTVPKNVCGHMRFERHLLSVFSLQFQRTRCRSPAHYPLRPSEGQPGPAVNKEHVHIPKPPVHITETARFFCG